MQYNAVGEVAAGTRRTVCVYVCVCMHVCIYVVIKACCYVLRRSHFTTLSSRCRSSNSLVLNIQQGSFEGIFRTGRHKAREKICVPVTHI